LGSRAEATGWVIVIIAIATPTIAIATPTTRGRGVELGRLILATSAHYTHTFSLYGVLLLITL
jgi:hypothetical protein